MDVDGQTMQGAGLDHEAVSRRAYELFVLRGGRGGSPAEDWLRAEAELRTSRTPRPQVEPARVEPARVEPARVEPAPARLTVAPAPGKAAPAVVAAATPPRKTPSRRRPTSGR